MTGEYISGYLITSGGGPDNSLPRPPHHPDNSLPGVEGPVDPGYGVPLPPVVSHPIAPTPGHPIVIPPTYPSNELPGTGHPGHHPDNSLPFPPTTWPKPPVTTWPPPTPIYPTHPIYPGIGPGHDLPLPPGSVWPPLPPEIKGKILCFVWIVGVGYRWTVIDPSLHIDIGLPGSQPGIDNEVPGGGHADNTLPETPEPKRR